MAEVGSVEVVVGTYEEFLLGYKLLKNSEGKYCFKRSFSDHSHIKSIRSVASNERFLASGGADEAIHLYYMKTRKNIGSLQHHVGTITSLEFFETHLFSGSEDGTICIWSTKNWECEKTLLGHQSTINDISIHPSGKMALTVSKDRTLRTWNLIKGRSAYVTNIKKNADFVQWCPDGQHFVIGCESTLDIYSVENGGMTHSMDFKKRINAICFLSDAICAFGDEAGQIVLYDIQSKETISTFTAHTNRVKALKCVNREDNIRWLCTGSSDGYLKLWQMDLDKVTNDPELICEANTTCRPTSLCILAAT